MLEDVPVKRGETQSISLEYRAFSCVLPKSSRGELTFEVDMQNELSAPIKKGEVLGQIVYKIGAETVGKSDILARDEVGSITFFAMIMKFLYALVSI